MKCVSLHCMRSYLCRQTSKSSSFLYNFNSRLS
jgi:hypothetical protein